MAVVRDIQTKKVVAGDSELASFRLQEVSEGQYEITAANVDALFVLLLEKCVNELKEEITVRD